MELRREAAGAIAEHIAGPLHPNSAGFFIPLLVPSAQHLPVGSRKEDG